MVAVAKNEPFVGYTLKALVGTMVKEAESLSAISKELIKNFPRKFAKPIQQKKIPKIVLKTLKALHRGKLKFDKIETVHVPAPTEAIAIKGVVFTPPKAYTKPKKEKSKPEPKGKAFKSKTKKTIKRVSVDDDGVTEVE